MGNKGPEHLILSLVKSAKEVRLIQCLMVEVIALLSDHLWDTDVKGTMTKS